MRQTSCDWHLSYIGKCFRNGQHAFWKVQKTNFRVMGLAGCLGPFHAVGAAPDELLALWCIPNSMASVISCT